MIHMVSWVSLFLNATVIFHILLFTVWKNKDAKFWKKIDYIWLFLSSIALVGVAERYYHAEVLRLVQLAEYDLQNEYEAYQAWALNLMSYKLENLLSKWVTYPIMKNS